MHQALPKEVMPVIGDEANTVTPLLLYPSGKRELSYLSGDFSSAYSAESYFE
ncbi:hypothetical protein AVEN_55929-1, partial [Araneus ventricosus]